jgi:mono/diheme cytochrome c family protein
MKRIAPLIILLLALCACDEMTHQPKYGAYARSKLFADGKAMQSPPEGTIAEDDPAFNPAQRDRPPLSMALLERGQARFNIYCTPCHDQAGYGNGTVPNRGFPHPPSFHSDRLRQVPPQYIVDVIAFGHGAMYPFADRVDPHDRWAIAAYIRALQLSQNASLDVLSASERGSLAGSNDGQ